jgi:hypothetical protein
MSPFVPIVVPAERYVVFSNDTGETFAIDETVLTEDGATFTGEWWSPTLNRADLHRIATLHYVVFYYLFDGSVQTSFSVSGSGNGGVTWNPNKTAIVTPSDSIVSVGLDVTGSDVRFRILFDQDPIVTVVGYRPVVKPAGRADIG